MQQSYCDQKRERYMAIGCGCLYSNVHRIGLLVLNECMSVAVLETDLIVTMYMTHIVRTRIGYVHDTRIQTSDQPRDPQPCRTRMEDKCRKAYSI